jgi:hypothetical protein
MQIVEDEFSQLWWNNDPTFVEDNAINRVEVITEGKVLPDGRREICPIHRQALFNQVEKL